MSVDALASAASGFFDKKTYADCRRVLEELRQRCGSTRCPALDLNLRVVRVLEARKLDDEGGESHGVSSASSAETSLVESVMTHAAAKDVASSPTAIYNCALLLSEQRRFIDAARVIDPLFSSSANFSGPLFPLRLLALSVAIHAKDSDRILRAVALLTGLSDKGSTDDGSLALPMNYYVVMSQLWRLTFSSEVDAFLDQSSQIRKQMGPLFEAQPHWRNVLSNLDASIFWRKDQFADCLRCLTTDWVDLERLKEVSKTLHPMQLVARTILLNNMGCSYGALGRPNIATIHFRRALAECEASRIGGSMLRSLSIPISYNLGISLLLHAYDECRFSLFSSGEMSMIRADRSTVSLAFDALRRACARLSWQPLIWLRMAECCILYQSSLAWDECRGRPIVEPLRIAGRFALRFSSSLASSGVQERGEWTHPLSLTNARAYLQNALARLSDRDGYLRTKLSKSVWDDMRHHVLVDLAFVCLCLRDYFSAFCHCVALRDSKEIVSPYNRFLSSLYAAECLCRLDRAKEAMRFLSPNELQPLLTISRPKPQTAGAVASPSESDPFATLQRTENRFMFFRARSSFYASLSAAFILQSSLQQAREANAHAFDFSPVCSAAFVNQLYLDISEGYVSRALDLFDSMRSAFVPLAPGGQPLGVT